MTPELSPAAFELLGHASQAETQATARLAASVQRIAERVVLALQPSQCAAGYQAADGLLLKREGRCVTDSADSILAFAQDLSTGLVARMTHELRERAISLERLPLVLDGTPE